jgi:hypothetical protein
MKDLIISIVKHLTQSLTSKKFVTTLYTITWLCVILLLFMYKTDTISEAILWLIGAIFSAFVTGNVFGDHMGKSITIQDKDKSTDNK